MKTFDDFLKEGIDKYTPGDTSLALPVEQMLATINKLGGQWFKTWKEMQRASANDKNISTLVKEYESVAKAFVTLSDELEHFNHDLLNRIDP